MSLDALQRSMRRTAAIRVKQRRSGGASFRTIAVEFLGVEDQEEWRMLCAEAASFLEEDHRDWEKSSDDVCPCGKCVVPCHECTLDTCIHSFEKPF